MRHPAPLAVAAALVGSAVVASLVLTSGAWLTAEAPLKAAVVTGEGWTELSLKDFVNVNGDETTWKEVDGEIQCSGRPIGGARTLETYENFEMVLEWKHTVAAGNSGVFLWCPESAFTDLPPGSLPRSGIEVQVLDLGYEVNHLARNGQHSDWFTSHGDVFPVGASKMKPFTPEIDYLAEDGTSYHVGTPDGIRSFPTKRLSHDVGEWNHYYIRAINGEVRLWVNGEEVTGGNQCEPATGYLALEAEGAPVVFRNLRIRRLP
ncbi:hypothetical protein Poly30_00850 [Planctomycetes bacterium Poly30]|uniref:3-keto-alpha-glucoside-1,2-lyase/3-keto-2-hydroxy-glucal hydratase domain-containing protein n=1 Tax=Saltatorellus ferox TaxID=2528018 RepID=A0A518EKH1_9BACT|nr:hypothetical protein Poly30_00850 [Planctomycetes bacterium Poly30]